MSTFGKRETIGGHAQALLDAIRARFGQGVEDKEALITEIDQQLGDSVEKVLLIKAILDGDQPDDGKGQGRCCFLTPMSGRPLGWHVRCGATLHWQISSKTALIDDILPAMRTDVVLEHGGAGRRIVIDTKFTSIVTTGWYREQSLRSGYIYQMYAYLRSQVGCGDPLADSASGLLLHPPLER